MPQKTSALRYENVKHLLYHSTVNKQSTGYNTRKQLFLDTGKQTLGCGP